MAKRDPQSPPNIDEPHDRLRWARDRAGFDDATAAAKRHHWNDNTYRSHENGSRDISKKAAVKYAKAFKVTAGWILFGEGMMTPPLDPELVTLLSGFDTEDRLRQAKRLLRALSEDAA